MTAALLAFPSSRAVAGWWKQFAPLQPRQFWVGHFLLHRVEALVRVEQPCRLDPLRSLILRALALPGSGADVPPREQLEGRLHLGRQVLGRLLHGMASEDLIQADAARGWVLTARGQRGLEQGEYLRSRQERRVFHFLQGEPIGRGLSFLGLSNPPTAPWPAGADWEFDVGVLEACLGRPREWKDERGFPLDVQEVLSIDKGGAGPRNRGSLRAAWQRVILDRPERLAAALVLVPSPAGQEQLAAFAVQQDGWLLQAEQPLFALSADWRSVFPHLATEPAPDQWRQAWRAWCQPRNVPPADVEGCTLEPYACCIRIRAPGRLLHRLRAARSDAFKGEAWLLAGDAALRPAAMIELVEDKG